MFRMSREPAESRQADLRVERRGGVRAIGGIASRLTAGLADRRGWTAASLIAHWREIVGADLARRSQPERLVAQGRLAERPAPYAGKDEKPAKPPRRPAALRIRVAAAAALEIQHRENEILERVNGFFGYRAVDRLQLVQGAIAVPSVRRAPPPLDAARARAISDKAAAVRDPDLRAALERLGQSIARQR